jgi:DNA repair protein RadC
MGRALQPPMIALLSALLDPALAPRPSPVPTATFPAQSPVSAGEPAPTPRATRLRLAPGGMEPLSDAELLAVLFGQGRPTTVHLERAHVALAALGGLAGLAQATPGELAAMPKLGAIRASVLAAAMELGRRAAGRRPDRGRRLGTAADVFSHYRARLGSEAAEEFWVLGLDVRHRLILEACIARGSLTGVEVHPREVYRPLIRAAAAAVIFCHNHPSGDPTPSRQDFDLTARLKEVGHLCGINVLDHVVVGADGYVSLAERGWL